MKILVVTQYYYPEDFRINDICEELAARGHNVTVLTGLPNYPEGKIFPGYEKAYLETEEHNGVKIVRFKCRPRYKGSLNLLRNYLSFAFNGKKAIKKLDKDFDVVYVYQLSPITSAIPALKYKRITKKPVFMYVCDLWPESVRDKPNGRTMSKKNPIYLIAKFLSKKIYQNVDTICVKCNEFIEYLVKECGVSKDKCSVLFEHAESNYLMVDEKPINNSVVDFMFLGNIGSSSNCELIVEATSYLKGDNFKVHFVGSGSELEHIRQLSSQLLLDDKIVFHGRHPQSEMISFYNLADVCLLTLSSSSAIGLTPPAKLTSYLAACRPIISSAKGASQSIIKNANCGFLCIPNDARDFSYKMQAIIDCPSVLNALGMNGRRFFLEHFTLEIHINNLEKMLVKK